VVHDGTQSPDFTFISDVVDAFVSAAQSSVAGDVSDVGTGTPVAMNLLDYWRPAPVWTPDSIEVATRDRFRYLGKE
jgi:nucleoside-diphosphate-sugar epimerase